MVPGQIFSNSHFDMLDDEVMSMPSLAIRLFGEFGVERDGQQLTWHTAAKAQQLLAFLLLNHNRSQHRETILGALWSETPAAQGRKALRQALWQLQTALRATPAAREQTLVRTEADRIVLSLEPETRVDVAAFRQAYTRLRGLTGDQMTADVAGLVEEAVNTYHGDLLDGWYFDWLLYERESFQSMYLILLDKLMTYYEVNGNYELGLIHGQQILRHDRAHERAHRRLMRLYFLRGDRTSALRQFDRCVTALAEELDVKPASATLRLFNQIRDGDNLPLEIDAAPASRSPTSPLMHSLDDVIEHLKLLRPIPDNPKSL
jgi:DNA-binding SARP family transcriptional activator